MAMRLEGPLPSTSLVETQTRYHIYNFSSSYLLIYSICTPRLQGVSAHLRKHIPFIPSLDPKMATGRFFGLLCTQKWSSVSKIAGLPPSLPILMMSGPLNSVIFSEMEQLWRISRTRGQKQNVDSSGRSSKDEEEEGLITSLPQKDVFEFFEHGA